MRHVCKQKRVNLIFCDFYLWGSIKGKVYKNNPRSIEALQNDITRVIGSIAVDELQKRRIIYLCDSRHVCKQKGVNFSTCYKSR
jgi:hypothetical protein